MKAGFSISRRPNTIVPDGDVAWVVLTGRDGEETGRVAVDAADVSLVGGHHWVRHSGGYASAYAKAADGRRACVYMHRIICNDAGGLLVDHIDGDRLNNRRCNLRPVTHMQSAQNIIPHVENTSGRRGVYLETRTGSWRAAVGYNLKSIRSPRFDNIDDADRWAIATRAAVMTHENPSRPWVRP